MSVIIVQGNIGVGKSYVVKQLVEQFDGLLKYSDVVVVNEPIDLIMQLFNDLKDPNLDFSLTVLNYQIQIIRYYETKVAEFNREYKSNPFAFCILERSPVDGIEIFTRLYDEQGLLRNGIFNMFKAVDNCLTSLSKVKSLVVVFVTASVETQVRRIKSRQTADIDAHVDVEHLAKVDKLYERYVNELKSGNNFGYKKNYGFVFLDNNKDDDYLVINNLIAGIIEGGFNKSNRFIKM